MTAIVAETSKKHSRAPFVAKPPAIEKETLIEFGKAQSGPVEMLSRWDSSRKIVCASSSENIFVMAEKGFQMISECL